MNDKKQIEENTPVIPLGYEIYLQDLSKPYIELEKLGCAKTYDKSRELGEFFTPMGKRPSYMLERPPQSYCYVESLGE